LQVTRTARLILAHRNDIKKQTKNTEDERYFLQHKSSIDRFSFISTRKIYLRLYVHLDDMHTIETPIQSKLKAH
jgi:hypothetical protein